MIKLRKAIMAALVCQMALAAPAWSLEVGEPIPDFGVKSLTGGNISRSNLAGKPALLVFWNTWCPTCRKELPEINKLAQKYVSQGLAILAINTGLNDSEIKAGAYWKKSGYLFPSGFDSHFDVGESFGLQGVPTVVLVDASGIIRYKSPYLPDNMDERIRQLTRR